QPRMAHGGEHRACPRLIRRLGPDIVDDQRSAAGRFRRVLGTAVLMTRALLITNPFAARADARAVTAILRILGRGGWNVDLPTTTGPGDARRIAEQARGEGFDVLVSTGGDGTELQVAHCLVDTVFDE